jgi:hypothetical protein
MAMKATVFRAQMYQVLADVLHSGKTVEIELSGRVIELRSKPEPGSKLGKLVRRSVIESPSDDLLSAEGGLDAWGQKWDAHLGTMDTLKKRKRAGGSEAPPQQVTAKRRPGPVKGTRP